MTDPATPVAIYREMLLNPTEPYIRTQAEALRRYRSFYFGVNRVPNGLALPSDRTFVLQDRYAMLDAALDRVLTRLPARAPFALLSRGRAIGRVVGGSFLRSGRSRRLVDAIRNVGATLLHAHTGINGAQALPLAQALDIPLVVTFHGYDATASDAELATHRTRGALYLERRAAMTREIGRAVAVSGYIRDRLVERGWPAELVVVHHMGVDVETYVPSPSARPLRDRKPIVLFAGRLIEKKGLAYLIDAMALVRTSIPDAELVVAGTGPLRETLARRAEDAGVRVEFLGRIPPEAVGGWMAEASLYCMPSVRAANGDAEGLPTAVVEAMACGLPVVATRHAGIPEAVVHGETGLLSDERDVATLASHLTSLLGDAELRARFGDAARVRATTHFDHRHQATLLESIYDDVRERHRERAAERRP